MKRSGGWPTAIARSIGLPGEIAFTQASVGMTLHIPCSHGAGHVADEHIPPGPAGKNMPPEYVVKKLLQRGWTIRRKLLCPEHSRKPRGAAQQEGEQMATKDDTTKSIAPAEEQRVMATPAAGKAKRLVYMALEDYYDETAKRYKPGYSDESIAKECGLSIAAVKAIREESYGPLAEPAELDGIRAELKQVRAEAAAMAAALADRITAVERKLADLIRANGWNG